jgi:VanZ family protein
MSHATQAPPTQTESAGRSVRGTAPHLLFRLYLVAMALLFLLPVPPRFNAVATRFDGVAHFGIFMAFAFLHRLGRRVGAGRTFLLGGLVAGGVELVQWALPYRSAQLVDFAIGAAGAGVGVALSLVFERWFRGAGESAAPSALPGDEAG